MNSKAVLLVLVGVLVSSCGMVRRGTAPWERGRTPLGRIDPNPPAGSSVPEITTGPATADLSRNERKIKGQLDEAFKDWKGVPYVLGGEGYSGVDCSSFMQIVFEDYFEIKLPRNTRDQMKTGSSVRRNKIKLGDMVFFKTGRDSYHVGVMINNEQFMHASTSSGVMISGLQERYWADAYLTTRRIL